MRAFPARPRPDLLTRAVLGGLLLLGLTGCNGMLHPEDFPTDGSAPSAQSNPAEVTADDFGHSWNLTVDHGSVTCESGRDGDPALRFTAPDGTVYSLNDVDANAELPGIERIADGAVGPLRTYAFTVCDAPR
jgi:hypothetical protein